jgi:glyoxylase-like metal-dependent hydrolase (beta-lactamase superfamily II)
LRPGLWHWQAPHPEWRESEPWDQRVSSYAIDDGQRLVLFDPLAVPDEIEARAGEREPVIVLTAPWHERDAESLVQRLGAPVYTAAPDTAQDLMDKYGITREQAGDGSPDVVWLLKEGKGEAHLFSAGDRLPMGYEVFPGHKPNDVVFWIEQYNAVLAGDTLADAAAVRRSTPVGCSRVRHANRSPPACVRCSSDRSSSCSRPTAGRSTGPRSSAPWPDSPGAVDR